MVNPVAEIGMIKMAKLLKAFRSKSMKLRILILLCSMSFALMASAQASGGQIRRNTTKPRTEVKKHSNPRNAVPRVEQQSTQTYAQPAIQPISISSLATYNVVISTLSILSNAQGLCQSLRDKGWSAQIYLDPSNMYRVLMVGTNDEPEAILYRNNAKQTYPDAWILKVENGRAFKFE